MRQVGEEEIEKAITTGIILRGTKIKTTSKEKVKTKAKKKSYITSPKKKRNMTKRTPR